MNDQFLHRLREPPTVGFATALKAKLDLRAAAAATRKRFFYLMSMLVIGGTALAFVSPSVRQFIASTIGTNESDADAQPGVRRQPDGSATMSSDTAPNVAPPVKKQIGEPRDKNAERTKVFDTPQATDFSNRTARTSRAALISKHAQSLDAELEALPPDGRVLVDGAGATFAIFEAVREEFEIRTKKTRVSNRLSGTGGGFRKLCRGEADIVGASRPILKPEMEFCAAAGTKFIELPIAYEALAVIVNSNATWISEITTDELKKMWEPAAQGRVVRWDQINDAWPSQSFQLFGPRSNSALFDYFTESIVGEPKSSRSDYIGTDFSNFVTNGVSRYTGAIGYVGYTSDIANASQVKILKIVNSAGVAVSPSEAAFMEASYDPLSRPLFMYVNAERAGRPEVRAFVKFLLTQGAKWIDNANGVPLPADMDESALARFESGKAGTVFDGKSAIGVQLDEALAREPVQLATSSSTTIINKE